MQGFSQELCVAKGKGQGTLGVAYPLPGSEAYLLCPAFIRSLILVVNPAEVGNV